MCVIAYFAIQFCGANLRWFLFCFHSILGTQIYAVTVNDEDIEIANQTACATKLPFGCSEEYLELFTEIMGGNGWIMPTEELEAKELYLKLSQELSELL